MYSFTGWIKHNLFEKNPFVWSSKFPPQGRETSDFLISNFIKEEGRFALTMCPEFVVYFAD